MPRVTKRVWASPDSDWLNVFSLQFVPKQGDADDVSLPYTFSTNVDTTVDPGAGNVRLDNASMSLVTQVAISATDSAAVDRSTLISALQVGQRIGVIQDTNRFWIGVVVVVPTDNTTWFQIDVLTVEGGNTMQNNAAVAFTIRLSDALPIGSDHLQIQMALEWPWVPYRIFADGETAPKEEGLFAEADIQRIVIF